MTARENDLTTEYRLLNKDEFAGLLGCTTRTVDRMISAQQVPPSIIVKIPTGVKGKARTRFICGRAVAWIESLAGKSMENN